MIGSYGTDNLPWYAPRAASVRGLRAKSPCDSHVATCNAHTAQLQRPRSHNNIETNLALRPDLSEAAQICKNAEAIEI